MEEIIIGKLKLSNWKLHILATNIISWRRNIICDDLVDKDTANLTINTPSVRAAINIINAIHYISLEEYKYTFLTHTKYKIHLSGCFVELLKNHFLDIEELKFGCAQDAQEFIDNRLIKISKFLAFS